MLCVLAAGCVDHSRDSPNPEAPRELDAGAGADASDEADAKLEAVEHASKIDPSCVPPPDCMPITNFINIGVCCSETLRCGWDVSDFTRIAAMYPDAYKQFGLDPENPCAPRGSLYFEAPPGPEERIVGAGDDILVTPDCTSRYFTSALLAGCCLPNNTCGLSTADAKSAFVTLLQEDFKREPFTFAECVLPKQLNEQLASSALAAWAFVPPSKGKCDYAALDARLPPISESTEP